MGDADAAPAAGTAPSEAPSEATTAAAPGPKKFVKPKAKVFVEVPSSLFIFSDKNIVRRFCVWFTSWPPFDWFILGAICANCLVMAMNDKLPRKDKKPFSLWLEQFEPAFMLVFTLECLLKIIANGFILHKGAYLHNTWNILDFVVVFSGAVEMMPTEGSFLESWDLKSLRTVRVLRPLKLVSGLPSLQLVVKAILCALAPIMQIGVLVLFSIVIFAIVGLEFYLGIFHFACVEYTGPGPDDWVFAQDDIKPCHPLNVSGSNQCPEGTLCENKWIGPNNGITSFDNIAIAMLTVFQCVSMEGWVDVMYLADDALGDAYNWLFFVPLIVIGSFFMLNLVLGVLSGEFAKERERVENRSTFIALRQQQQFERELTGYLDWICKAEDLVLEEYRTTKEMKRSIAESRKRVEFLRKSLLTEEEGGNQEDALAAELALQEELAAQDDDEDEDEATGAGGEEDAPRQKKQKSFSERMELTILQYRMKARKTVKTSVFYWAVIGLVFLNTCTTAVEHYGQPQWLTDFLDITEVLFLTIFIAEMCFKIFALGPSTYWKSSFNKFDCLVIAGSTFELIYSYFKGASFGISVMRVLRLLRMFKMTPYWISLKNLVQSLLNSIKNIMSLLVLLFIFVLIFALLGMQMFGGKFSFNDGRPFYHFDTFPVACITVFQVITGEDWNAVMYTAIDAMGGVEGGGLIFSVYFVFIMLLGNYTLLNVFLAIAVDNLSTAQEMTDKYNAEQAMLQAEKERLENEDDMPEEPEAELTEIEIAHGLTKDRESDHHQKMDHDEDDDDDDVDDEDKPKPVVPYSSLFLMSSDNSFRVAVHNFVQHRYFETFILVVIVISSIAMATEDPVDENSKINRILGKLDYVFTFVFALECYLKIIDLGFVLHYGSYLRDFWNVLDFIVVAGAQFSMAVTTFASPETVKKLSVLKSIKVLRVLRPLKTIKRIPKLKAVFDCVVTSLKNVFNILIVYYIFQFIFAVIAVQLFKGKFFYCSDMTKKTVDVCHGNYFVYDAQDSVPSVEQRQWMQHDFNYDSTLEALLTLFVVTTGEGWPGIRQTSMDATYEDVGPSPFFHIEIALYYILFIIVFPFFFVNIFIALIITTFTDQGNDEYEEWLQKNEKQCIEYALNAKPRSLYMPENKESNQYKMWLVVTSQWFDMTVMAAIVINTFILMLKFYQQPYWLTLILNYINIFLICVFTFEFALKTYAYGPSNYIKDGWNKFDFVTVVGSIVDLAATELDISIGNLSFLRLFKAARLVRLLQKGQNIRILLWTFLQSLKALPYVCLLIAMLFFIYAIVGMQLFGSMFLDADSPINRLNNFQVFHKGLMLLFRCATGEAWHEIMIACEYGALCAAPDGGVNYVKGPTCGSRASVAYFLTFVFLSSFLMLNLFVAVIMDNFDYLTRDSSILGAHHLPDFITAWSNYDPAATGRVHYNDMYNILRDIPPPLGFGAKCPYKVAYKHLIRMNMPVDDNGTVHFTTTLFALIREALSIKMAPVEEMNEADEELRGILKHLFPIHVKKNIVDLALPGNNDLAYNKLTVGKVYSAKLIVECRAAKLDGEGFGASGGIAGMGKNKKKSESPPISPSGLVSPTGNTDVPTLNVPNGHVMSGNPIGSARHSTTNQHLSTNNTLFPPNAPDSRRPSLLLVPDQHGGRRPSLLTTTDPQMLMHSPGLSSVTLNPSEISGATAFSGPEPTELDVSQLTAVHNHNGVTWNPLTSVINYEQLTPEPPSPSPLPRFPSFEFSAPPVEATAFDSPDPVVNNVGQNGHAMVGYSNGAFDHSPVYPQPTQALVHSTSFEFAEPITTTMPVALDASGLLTPNYGVRAAHLVRSHTFDGDLHTTAAQQRPPLLKAQTVYHDDDRNLMNGDGGHLNAAFLTDSGLYLDRLPADNQMPRAALERTHSLANVTSFADPVPRSSTQLNVEMPTVGSTPRQRVPPQPALSNRLPGTSHSFDQTQRADAPSSDYTVVRALPAIATGYGSDHSLPVPDDTDSHRPPPISKARSMDARPPPAYADDSSETAV